LRKLDALQKRQEGSALAKFVERSRDDILPKHLNAERMLQLFVYTIKTNSKLMECSPESIADGVISASGMGLELNGPLQQCFLVPRKSKGQMHANFQVGYRGLITLLMRSGLFSGVDAEAVYEPDVFVYEKGIEPKLQHTPSLLGTRKDKPPVAFYAIAYPSGGGIPSFKVLTLADVQYIRDEISYWESTPWKTHPEAMALKTVIIRLCKLLPLATEAVKAAEEDRQREQTLQATMVKSDDVDEFGEVLDTMDAPQTGQPRDGFEDAT